MTYIKSMIIAFSMYSKLPVWQLELEEKDMRYVMGFFPFVGLVLGAIMYLWYIIASHMGLPDISTSLILMVLPVIVTGGIHLDGYMDTSDALNSYADKEKKLAILKDSHIGAFAVIKLFVYYVIYYAAVYCIVQNRNNMLMIVMALTCYMSRIMSGIAAVNLKGARADGMLKSFTSVTDRKRVNIMLIVQLTICMAALCFCNVLCAAAMLLSAIAVMIYYRHMAYKLFGGVTGDLAGYLLCVSELCMIVVLGIISLYI